MFGISTKKLLWVTSTMASMLDAGLPVSRVLQVLQEQAGKHGLRDQFRNVARRVSAGDTLAEAFQASGNWPSLFIRFIAIGEETGGLDRMASELTRFYETRQRVRRQFISQLALPVLQYVAAVFILCGALYILNSVQGNPTHLGRNMALGYGIPAALACLYYLMHVELLPGRWFQELLLQVPGLRAVVRNAALARFSRTMHLSLAAGLPIKECLDCSFQATDNKAYIARYEQFLAAVEDGRPLAPQFRASSLFPDNYGHVISVGEEAGKLSEKFEWLADNYTEEFERSLSTFATIVSRGVYALVAIIIIVMIFKLFASYAGNLSSIPAR